MRAYAMGLRRPVGADGPAGVTTPAVARRYAVGAPWVRRAERRHGATGSPGPPPPTPGRPVVPAPPEDRARAGGARRPAATPAGRRPRLAAGVGVGGPCHSPRRLKRCGRSGGRGGGLYLPPYRPGDGPIERAFAEIAAR